MNIIHGDCLEELKKLDDNSVDAVVCDPPYGLSNTKPAQVADVLKAWVTGDTVSVPAKRGGFMGKDWDSFVPPPAVWGECMRVLKPGGHMAVFAGARTQDLMGLSIRLAGFEIRDTLGWVYGSGFPKSMDISKAVDKQRDEDLEPRRKVTELLRQYLVESGHTRQEIDEHFGTKNVSQYWFSPHRNPQIPPVDKWPWLRDFLNIDSSLDREVWRLNGRKGTPGESWGKREVVGVREVPQGHAFAGSTYGGDSSNKSVNVTSSHSDAARQWDGWGTALKPAIEPIILARKPLDGTVANNVLEHGVGGLNIDACRVGTQVSGTRTNGSANDIYGDLSYTAGETWEPSATGRFPANVLLDEHAAKEMDKQSVGTRAEKPSKSGNRGAKKQGATWKPFYTENENIPEYSDSGGASRFFPVFKYQAKAPKKERPVIEREDGSKIQHPTVKPVALMEWLVSLIVPPGGTVLDPFAGSGTTLQAAINKGFTPIGIEQDADYIKLIEERLK